MSIDPKAYLVIQKQNYRPNFSLKLMCYSQMTHDSLPAIKELENLWAFKQANLISRVIVI